jgi:MFS family permease
MAVELGNKSGLETGRSAYDRFRGGVKEYLASVRSFTRNARLFLLGSFLVGFNFAVFELLLNLYLKELGFAEGEIGLVQSSRALGMTMIAIPAAVLLSRVKLKPLLMVCCVLLAIFSYGLSTWTQFEYLIGFGLLVGMTFAFFRVASGPFYMRNSTPKERTHLFSFSFATFLLAGMVGSLVGGNMVTIIHEQTGDMILSYQYTLYMGVGIGALTMLPLSLIKAAAPSAEENRINLSWEQFLRRRGFYFKITFVNFMVGVGAGLIIPFLNLYFRDRFGLAPDRIGFYFIILQFSMLAGTLCGPVFTPRLGLVRTIVITQLASIPFMLTLSYAYSLYLAVPAFIIRGALMNMGVPVNTNFCMELCEKSEQGLVNALMMVSWTGSWMVSVAIGGEIIEKYGYTVVLNIAVVCYMLSTLSYHAFFSKVEKRHPTGAGWYIPAETRL